MVIASAVAIDDFRRTCRYVAVRHRSVTPRVIHSSLPQVSPVKANPMSAADAMTEQAKLSDRVEKPCYHIALCANAEDHLSDWDWHQLTRGFLSKVGLDQHQSVAYLHEDATFAGTEQERPHVHLVVNRVDAQGKAASTSWDYYRFQTALRELETEMGLTAESNSWDVDRRRDTPGQVHRLEAQPASAPTIRTQLQDAIDEAVTNAASLEGVANFLQHAGIDIHISDRGWSVAKEGVAFAGYQLGPSYTLPAIEKTLGSTMYTHDGLTDDPDFATDGGLSEAMEGQTEEARDAADGTRRVYMGDLLRRSARGEATQRRDGRSQMLGLAQDLMGYGNRLTHQGEIDGLTVIGVGAVAAGAGLALQQKFQDTLEAARNQGRSDRVQGFIDRLDGIGQRTDNLETQFGQNTPDVEPDNPHTAPEQASDRVEGFVDRLDKVGQRTDTLEAQFQLDSPDLDPATSSEEPPEEQLDSERPPLISTEVESKEVRTEAHPTDPVVETIVMANGRIDQLDQVAGIISPESRFEIDPRLPLDQQLDQVEAAIGQLEERLTLLEGRAQAMEEQQAAQRVPGEQVAQTLSHYSEVRAAAYLISPDDPIQTRTMGTIQVSNQGQHVSIQDPNFGIKFSADHGEDGWHVETDELSAKERTQIAELPQTQEAYATQARGKDVIKSLQQLAPNEFSRPEGGGVTWEATTASGATQRYTFAIEHRPDGMQLVVGKDTQDTTVLESRITQEGVIRVSQANIPPEQIDGLAKRVNELQSSSQPTPQAHRHSRPHSSKQQEGLSL